MTLDIDFIADIAFVGDKSEIEIGDNDEIGGKSERINQIIEFISEKGSAAPAEIAEHVGLSTSRIRDYLKELTDNGMITYDGTYRDSRYKLNGN